MDLLASNFSRGSGEEKLERSVWAPWLDIHQGRGWNGASCGAEPLRGPVCPQGEGVTALCTGVGPVRLWVPAAPAGWDQRKGDILHPCSKPLAAPAVSTARWGATVQDSGVEMSPVLQQDRPRHATRLAWPRWPSANKCLFLC